MISAQEARNILPMVYVKFHGKSYACRTSGRCNEFATVYAEKDHGLTAEFTWESIARAYNTKCILQS